MQSAAQTAVQTAVHTIWRTAMQTTTVQSTMQTLTKRTLGVMSPQLRTRWQAVGFSGFCPGAAR
eukprot:687629-Pleurochrysis_carterae.AAC.1